MNEQLFQALVAAGIINVMGAAPQLQPAGARLRMATDGAFACDAQPAMVTVSSSGIPAFLSTFIDPRIIEVLTAPLKAVEIAGKESKKGDWITRTAMFPMVEMTGETAAYGDYSTSGTAGVNSNYPQRQSYHYQTMVKWGERELEEAGLARIDLANKKRLAGTLALNQFQNRSYFNGIAGLQNYGLLNDPNLSAAITPVTKAAGGTLWASATADEIVADVGKLYKQLQTQMPGKIDLSTAMTLAMSPISETALTKTSAFNVNVFDILKKNYPGLKIKTAPQYSTGSGELLQLIVDSVDGQETMECAFTEKLRAHPVITLHSAFEQKHSQGTWGTIIYLPAGIAQMLGV